MGLSGARQRLRGVKCKMGTTVVRHLTMGSVYFCLYSTTWGSCLHVRHIALTTQAWDFLHISCLDGVVNVCHSSRWQRAMVLGFSVGSESGAVKCSALTASLAAPHTVSDPLFSSSPLPDTSLWFAKGVVGFLGEEMGPFTYISLTADCVIEMIAIGQKVEALPWKLGLDFPRNINNTTTTELLVIMSKWVIHECTYWLTATVKETL